MTIRILHSADWHLGRRFDRLSLEDDQRRFLEWLAGLVDAEGIDLVVVAGDVYDRAFAPEEAVELLDEGLDGLRSAGAKVVMIPGNHDSAQRLGFGSTRQVAAGIHVVADDREAGSVRVIEFDDGALCVAAIPFLDPHSTVRFDSEADGARTHGSVLAAAISTARSQLVSTLPSLLVAHGTVTGGSTSDSERVIEIGGASSIGVNEFEGFDAVALGHLHRPQTIIDDAIAYSGSPLAYSYSEDHRKSVRLIEIEEDRSTSFRTIEIPVGRRVATLTGELSEILEDPRFDRHVDDFVFAVLSDGFVRSQAMEQIQKRFPFATSLRYLERAKIGHRTRPLDVEELRTREPFDVIDEYFSSVIDRELDPFEKRAIADALDRSKRALS